VIGVYTTRFSLSLTFGLVFIPAAPAHYHMLLPDKPSAKRGETVTFTYQFGHPFEHQLFDTRAPVALFVLTPGGQKIDVWKSLEKTGIDGADGKKVTAYRFTFRPEQRGDYTFVAVTEPIKLEGDQETIRDVVKVVLHVVTQNGWDRKAGELFNRSLEVSPLTRPYGLRAGMGFQVEVEEKDMRINAGAPAGPSPRPVAGVHVEVERFNPTPPKELPPDEHITRVVRTDAAGAATATLTEPGWWCLTAFRDEDGVRSRSTLWVYVDDKVPLGPAK
jgi:cobalt/nickel transport protein